MTDDPKEPPRMHDLEPGAYEYDVLADHDGLPQRLIETGVARFVTDNRVHNKFGEFTVQLTLAGELEVRCSEGRLLVGPNGSNEVIVRIEGWS